MNKKNNILSKKIEAKTIVWFKNSNSYLILENFTSQLIKKLLMGTPVPELEKWCVEELDVSKSIALTFIKDVTQLIKDQDKTLAGISDFSKKIKKPEKYFSSRIYFINSYYFLMKFETEFHELLVHPKFAHLEVNSSEKKPAFVYEVFNCEKNIAFINNDTLINQWPQEEIHLFQGKLSMHILMDIYQKPESDWLGVFHASALSNGKETILFLGDSGNGKSTSLALLNANGFSCIADDFVPVDSDKKVYTYPAGISIKKNSLKTLLPYYPELEGSAEYHFKRLKKIVRFLAPKKINYTQKLSCKALIFIKYNSEVALDVHQISKIDAFQQLVPDSWISPLENNAGIFLDWFLELPCYQLTYSNNEKMIATVNKIFNDEL